VQSVDYSCDDSSISIETGVYPTATSLKNLQDTGQLDCMLSALQNSTAQEAHGDFDLECFELLTKKEWVVEETLVDVVNYVRIDEMARHGFVETAVENEVAIENLGEVTIARIRVGFETEQDALNPDKLASGVPWKVRSSCPGFEGPLCDMSQRRHSEYGQGEVICFLEQGRIWNLVYCCEGLLVGISVLTERQWTQR
jgi:hypothetical protein